MTHDELLVSYLDGMLSDDQRREFDTRLQASPALAQEVRELTAIQGLLTSRQDDDNDEAATAFLRRVENNLATALIGAGAAATVGTIAAAAVKSASITAASVNAGVSAVVGTSVSAGAAGGVGAWLSSVASAVTASVLASTTTTVVSLSIGAAVVAGGTALTYRALQHSPTTLAATSHSEVSQTYTRKQQAPGVPDAVQSKNPVENHGEQHVNEQHAVTQRESPISATPTAPPLAKSPAREYTARVSASSSMNAHYAATVNDYTQQLEAKQATGDRVSAAAIEKSLGALLREAGNQTESRQHLQQSLKAAQTLGLKELEGEARGELGLLERAVGNKKEATRLLNEAVVLLTVVGSKQTERWQRELERALQQ